jgi:glutaredoxin 3
MSRILLYTTPFCRYCRAAKRLLERKGHAFVEIDVSGDRGLREEMIARALGVWTVPQIFIDGRHVGGYDELAQLDRDAKLDPWLAAEPLAAEPLVAEPLAEEEASTVEALLAEADAAGTPQR